MEVLIGVLDTYPLEVCVPARDIKPTKTIVLPLPGGEIMKGLVDRYIDIVAAEQQWDIVILPQVKDDDDFAQSLSSLVEEYKDGDLNIAVPQNIFIAWQIFRIAGASAKYWTVEFRGQSEWAENVGSRAGDGITGSYVQRKPGSWRLEQTGYRFRQLRWASKQEWLPKILPRDARAIPLG